MGSDRPAPRPALRRAADGSVHPASPRVAPLAAVLEPVGGRSARGRSGPGGEAKDGKGKERDKKDRKDKKAAKKGKRAKAAASPGARGNGPGLPVDEDGATVSLDVPMPKAMRRRLRDKAAEHGYTPEEAAYHLLVVWLDG